MSRSRSSVGRLSAEGQSRRVALAALVVAMGFVAATCAEVGEPDLGVGQLEPAQQPEPSEDDPDNNDEPEDDPAEVENIDSALPVFSPPRPAGFTPSLVVSTAADVVLVDTAATEPVEDAIEVPLDASPVPIARLVDDFFGGLVVQERGADDGEAFGTIRWFRAEGGEPSIVASNGEQLLDVGFLDATLEAHALVSIDGVVIDRIRLADGERAPFASVAEGQTIIDLSASEGIHVVVVADENCGAMLFWNSGGDVVDLGGPGQPPCVVARRPAFGAVDLSPDGTKVAYTELTYRSDGVVASTELIVRELGSDAIVFSLPVGGPGEVVSRLSFDGNRLGMLRSDDDSTTVVIVPIIGQPDETNLEFEANPIDVVFSRQPVALGR